MAGGSSAPSPSHTLHDDRSEAAPSPGPSPSPAARRCGEPSSAYDDAHVHVCTRLPAEVVAEAVAEEEEEQEEEVGASSGAAVARVVLLLLWPHRQGRPSAGKEETGVCEGAGAGAGTGMGRGGLT